MVMFQLDGWSFQSRQGPLMTSQQIHDMHLAIPPPTMPFDSHILVTFKDTVALAFTTPALLHTVKLESPKYKVSVNSDFWKSTPYKSAQSFDWCYTPVLPSDRDKCDTNPFLQHHHLLTDTTTPILHYTSVDFYEDELSDNGSASLSIRLRVMQFGFVALLKHHVRVDRVASRCEEWRFLVLFNDPASLYTHHWCMESEDPMAELRVADLGGDVLVKKLFSL